MRKFLAKYFSIVLVLATFLIATHIHDDLHEHDDCQICTIQANLAHGDVPTTSHNIVDIPKYSQAIKIPLAIKVESSLKSTTYARAPPKLS